MDEFTVDADFESVAIGRNELYLSASRHLANFRRQTDGFRLVVSDRAVFDRDLRFHENQFSAAHGTGQASSRRRLRRGTYVMNPLASEPLHANVEYVDLVLTSATEHDVEDLEIFHTPSVMAFVAQEQRREAGRPPRRNAIPEISPALFSKT